MKGLLIPKIRFKGFTDDWEQRKLGEVTNSIDTGRSKFISNSNGKYEVLGSTSIIGYDDNYDYEGDFLLTARVGANAGELYRHSGKVKISDNTVFIQAYNLNFIFYMLMNFDIKRLSFGTGQPLIKASELRELKLKLPKSKEERSKIGTFFTNLDKLITLHQRKHDKLIFLKKSMLEKMFPQKGEKIPEVRFSGFNNDWEQRKFEEIFEISQGLQIAISERFSQPGENRFFYITNEFLKSDYEGKYYVHNPSENVVCNRDDILMTRTGNTGIVVTDVEGCFHNNFFKIKYDKQHFNKYFICQFLSSPMMQKRILSSAGSSTIPDLSHKSFYKLDGFFPRIEEQKKISNFIINLDNLITLHQRKAKCITKLKISTLIFLMEGDK